MQVILVRHGEPGGTPKGAFLGRTNPPLGPEGAAQADALGQFFKQTFPDIGTQRARLCASPLLRAHQTAGPIAAALDLAIEPMEELVEIDFGAWDGQQHAVIDSAWDGAGSAWIQDPLDHTAPDGESFRHVGARVDRFWQREVALRQEPLDVVIVVAHFCPLAWLAGGLLGLSAHQRIACRLNRGQAGCIEDGVLRWWGVPMQAGGFF